MQRLVAIIGLTLLSTSCQTTDRGTNSTTKSNEGGGTPCALEIALNCPTGQHDGCATGKTAVHQCIEGEAATGAQEGINCALEIALACEDDEVDGCLTGQSSVHKCVSDGSTSTPAGVQTVRLYEEPHFLPSKDCNLFTELKFERGQVTLTNKLEGTCEIAVSPNPRTFLVTSAPDGCGTKVYKGQSDTRSIVIEDNTQRTCENVTLARLTVVIHDGSSDQRLYSED